MQAALSRRYGPADRVTIEDVPVPAMGAESLLVRVHATTVTRTDCSARAASPFITRAFLGLRRPRQPILGCEFAGVVEQVGASVTRFQVGERVFGYTEPRFGCHAAYVAVAEDAFVTRIPDRVSFEEAAGATEGAHYALANIRAAGIGPGSTALVHGASGAIGSAAMQLLPHFGATVTAVCATPELERVRARAPGRVIDRLEEDFTRCGEQFDLVFDAVGKSSFAACRRLLKPRGIYASTDLGPHGQNPPLAIFGLVARRPQRVQFPIPRQRPEDLELIRRSLDDGSFAPLIDSVRPLGDVVAAYQLAESGRKVGSIVLLP